MTVTKVELVVSLKRILVGTLTPAPLGSLVIWAYTVATEDKSLDLTALSMIPLFAMFGYLLVGLQSLASASLLEFMVLRPGRSAQFALLSGATLGAVSVFPFYKAGGEILFAMSLGALVGMVTAWAMRSITAPDIQGDQ